MASAHVILKQIRQRFRVAVSRDEKSKSDLPLVGKLINQVDLNASFDKKWELRKLHLGNGDC